MRIRRAKRTLAHSDAREAYAALPPLGRFLRDNWHTLKLPEKLLADMATVPLNVKLG